jgi:hypothetical protein
MRAQSSGRLGCRVLILQLSCRVAIADATAMRNSLNVMTGTKSVYSEWIRVVKELRDSVCVSESLKLT